MTNPLPNMQSGLVRISGSLGFVIPPWNSWFQQFSQKAPAIADVTTSPFTANANGTVIFTGVSTSIILVRGLTTINLTGQRIIPISIGDTIAWADSPTVQFLGA